ncbi:hypothetical protein [Luteimonas sp. R10]|uniref:hypothetical protein n=1 Tax=Luteimonas sp. R10 TaxID=3108176 RepID=UPI003085289D|nr:hypothetical protein U3649_06470 [Luteimonas sp. R10]
MSKRAALVLLCLNCFVYGAGAASGRVETDGWLELILVVLVLVWVFAWLAADRREHGHRRSIWMNLGTVFFTLVAIPVYLTTTRPRGQRLRALRGYALALLGALGATFLGGMAGGLLSLRAPVS